MGQIKKLANAHVIPRDAIDCNHLASIVGKLPNHNTSREVEFRVGIPCWFCFNLYDGAFMYAPTYSGVGCNELIISVNELARQLAMT